MYSIRRIVPAALVIVAFSAGWFARTTAQQNAPVPTITYFSHDKVDASFAKAIATDGSRIMFTRKDTQGRSFSVHTNSRTKSDEGQPHSHQGWTAVVVIVSGAATFVTPGAPAAPPAAKAAAMDDLGGQSIGSGETHRIGKGDVIIIPPGVPHIYKNVEEPFHYIVVETPL
jgi:quercetin dioxygenase-like cupin family protein